MYTIKNFFKSRENIIYIFLNLAVLFVIAFTMNFLSPNLLAKKSLYFLVIPILFIVITQIKSNVIIFSIILFMLAFIDRVIISGANLLSLTIDGINYNFIKSGPTLLLGIFFLALFIFQKGFRKIPFKNLLLWIILLFTLIISMLLGSSSIGLFSLNTSNFFMYYLGFFIIYLLGYHFADNVKDLKYFLLIISLVSGLVALGHLFAVTTNFNFQALGGGADESIERDGPWRYGAFFGNVNTLSGYYIMILPTLFIYLFREKNLFYKLIISTSLTLVIISLLMTGSRAGIGFGFLNLIIAVFFLKINFKSFIPALIILAAVILIALSFTDIFQEYIDRSFNRFERAGTDTPRYEIWYYTIQIIIKNPLGIGLSSLTYTDLMSQMSNLKWATPHNSFLEFAIQSGITGAIILSVIIISPIVKSIKILNSIPNQDVKDILVSFTLMVLGFIFIAMTEPAFHNGIKLNYMLAISLGILTNLLNNIKQPDTFS